MARNGGTDTTGYYYNVRTGQVEHGNQSGSEHLLGPYDTRAQAEAALESARARTEAWDAEDAAWDRGADRD